MIAQDLMTPDPWTIEAEAPLREALARMVDHDVRELPVVEDGDLVGMITDRDLKMVLGPGARSPDEGTLDDALLDSPVRRWMSDGVEAVSLTDDAAEVCRVLGGLRVGAVPVLDADDRLVGIVSVTDVLAAAAALFEAS